jgi:hypothetical protein
MTASATGAPGPLPAASTATPVAVVTTTTTTAKTTTTGTSPAYAPAALSAIPACTIAVAASLPAAAPGHQDTIGYSVSAFAHI